MADDDKLDDDKLTAAAIALGAAAFGFGCADCGGLTELGRRRVRDEGLSFFTEAERLHLQSMVNVVLAAVGDPRASSATILKIDKK